MFDGNLLLNSYVRLSTIQSVLESGNHKIRYPLCPEDTLHKHLCSSALLSPLPVSTFVECYQCLLWEFEWIQTPSNVKSVHKC